MVNKISQVLSAEKAKSLETSCLNLSKLDQVRHVAVINKLGSLVAGGMKKGITSYLDDKSVRMVYMQLQLDFQMRQELDDILGPIDYIASKRKKVLVISVPVHNYIVMITANPDADDKKIIQKTEELFDDLSF